MSTLHLTALKSAIDQLLALGTLKAYFMDPSFTPNAETHQYYDDISSDVAAGTASVTLAGVTTTIDAANGRVELDTNNFSLVGVTATTDKYCLVLDTGNDATSPVIASVDITEGSISAVAGDISITVNNEGHFAINAS